MEKRRGPRDPLIRRRPRQQTIIELPAPRPLPEPPNPLQHAKLFTLALLGVIAAGTVLLATPWTTESGERTAPIDALFTAVSAVAVTGLVTVDTQEHWNLFGEIVILLLIQLGGLGFIVGASLVLQALRGGQTRLNDMVLLQQGDPTVSLRDTGRLVGRIVRFVLLVEGAGAILLTLYFWQSRPFLEALWHGVFHAVSAFCNAGFDLHGGFRSMTGQDTAILVNVVMMVLIQTGALSYLVLADLFHKRRRSRLALDTKLVISGHLLLLAVGAGVFLIVEWNRTLTDMAVEYRPMAALFQSVAARTAGFATINFGEAHVVTLFVWVAIMLVGGASGSTAGGAKISTVAVVVVSVLSTLRGREEPSAFNRRLAPTLVFRAMSVIAILLLVHFAITLLLVAIQDRFAHHDMSFISLMFEAMSAIALVGLTTGNTPDLATASKLVLCFAMFFGRLGPLSAAYALQRRQKPVRYRLPEGTVRIG